MRILQLEWRLRERRFERLVCGNVQRLGVVSVELRRLVGVKRAYDRMNEGDGHLAREDFDAAARSYERAQEAVPENVEFTFWRGVMLANFGKLDEARAFLERTYGAPGDWAELLRRLPSVGLLPEDLVEKLT